jgi:RNA polymerase sigma-70 factor (ECF subfamily)
MDEDDARLAQAAARREPKAQEAIVRAHYEWLHRCAWHLCRNHSDAQDLAQRTFLKGFRHMGRFDGRGSLRSWLAGILFHEASHLRRARRVFGDLKSAVLPDPSGRILEREILLDAIHGLSMKLKETFILVELNELTIAEAALSLGVPEGTIKSRLSEARSKLRQQLEAGQPSPQEVRSGS